MKFVPGAVALGQQLAAALAGQPAGAMPTMQMGPSVRADGILETTTPTERGPQVRVKVNGSTIYLDARSPEGKAAIASGQALPTRDR